MIILCHMVMKTQYLVQYIDPGQYPHKKGNSVTCGTQFLMLWLGTVNKDNRYSFSRWCTYLVSLYKKYGYILGVLRPQPFPEDVIETVNSQKWYNHIIGFYTSFHSMIWPKKSHTGYLQLEESTANTHFDVLFYSVWSHHWLKMPYFGHISCLLR